MSGETATHTANREKNAGPILSTRYDTSPSRASYTESDTRLVFFISFREALEAGIIVSVLIAILDKTLNGTEDAAAMRKTLVRQACLASSTRYTSLDPTN